MAHFAQLDQNNVVIQVIVVSNDDIKDNSGLESEAVGVDFCKSLLGADTVWKQTSYNANFRKNYAGIGFRYYQDKDAFVPPMPYPSWTLNAATCQWEAPVAYPTDGKRYVWNEDTHQWTEVI